MRALFALLCLFRLSAAYAEAGPPAGDLSSLLQQAASAAPQTPAPPPPPAEGEEGKPLLSLPALPGDRLSEATSDPAQAAPAAAPAQPPAEAQAQAPAELVPPAGMDPADLLDPNPTAPAPQLAAPLLAPVPQASGNGPAPSLTLPTDLTPLPPVGAAPQSPVLASPGFAPPAQAPAASEPQLQKPPPLPESLSQLGAAPAAPRLPQGPTGPVSVSEGPEVAVILADGRFHPSRIRIRSGSQTRILFTTINRKPAALIIERLRVQTWIARAPAVDRRPAADRWEVNREITTNRVTDIRLDPAPGTYSFHDAISGASGEIIVE